MSDFPDPTGAHARMRSRVGDAIDRVWSAGDEDDDEERDRLVDAVMEPVSALMEGHKRMHLDDLRLVEQLRKSTASTGNLHVALSLALGVQPHESDAKLIERVRSLVAVPS